MILILILTDAIIIIIIKENPILANNTDWERYWQRNKNKIMTYNSMEYKAYQKKYRRKQLSGWSKKSRTWKEYNKKKMVVNKNNNDWIISDKLWKEKSRESLMKL